MFLPVSLCHDSRAGSRFLSSAGKLNSPASNWRADWPENYAFNLWLQQRIIPRRWEGGELGHNSEDFWLFGDVLETWFGKSIEMGKWKGWEKPWDAQDSWRRGRDERRQWKNWRRWSGKAHSSCWWKAFPLLLVCHPTDSSFLLSSTSACTQGGLQMPRLEVMDLLFQEQQS